jgi:hypothetical protein
MSQPTSANANLACAFGNTRKQTMPLLANKENADAHMRDLLADGNAARMYARGRDLPDDWLLEIIKRLLIQLERAVRSLEDSTSKAMSFDTRAIAIDRLLQILIKLNRTAPGRALFEKAMAETDDTPQLQELARRLALLPPAEYEASLSESDDGEAGQGPESEMAILGSSSATGAKG